VSVETVSATIKAPAKVNLFLRIGKTRPDGFHELVSMIQAVGLYDTIRISATDAHGECMARGNMDIPPENNTIVRAAELFRREADTAAGLELMFEKSIPSGAGLGGGSSDAAAVLRGLNALYRYPLSDDRLAELAGRIGSDVPFFLGSAAAVVTGRGESLHPLSPRTDYHLLLIYPGFSVSTAHAYAQYDLQRRSADNGGVGEEDRGLSTEGPGGGWSADGLAHVYQLEEPTRWPFFNTFNSVVFRIYPGLDEVCDELRDAGALYAGVTGSGSCLVSVFIDSEAAVECSRLFRRRFPLVRPVPPLDTIPQPGLEYR